MSGLFLKYVMRMFFGAVAAVLAFGPLLGPATAMAADANPPESKPLNLVTSPLPINLSATPGSKVSAELRVKQGSPGTERLKVSLMKFGAYGEEGKPALMDRGPGDDYFDWVKFDRNVFDAPSNVWQTIKMTINVPKSAAFGYYYAAVFSRAGDDTRRTGNVNSLNGGTAVLVLLDAKVPNAKREMKVASFGTDHRVYEFLPANFKIKFANTGNVHLVPHGNIFITKGKKEVASLTLNEEQGNTLPNSKRVYFGTWQDGFPHYETRVEDGKVKLDKKSKPIMDLTWSNGGPGNKSVTPHFRFGKYTAHLFAVYDDGKRDVPMEAEVSFWVVPWRFLLAVLVVLVLVGLGVFMTARGAWRGARRLGNKRK